MCFQTPHPSLVRSLTWGTAPILFTAPIFAVATIPHGIKDIPVLALPMRLRIHKEANQD